MNDAICAFRWRKEEEFNHICCLAPGHAGVMHACRCGDLAYRRDEEPSRPPEHE